MTIVTVDVGGTTLRTARYDPETARLFAVRRVPVEGVARYPHEPVPALQKRVVDQLVREIGDQISSCGEPGTAVGVGVAFAGPVTGAGVVTAAPTVWGGAVAPLPLRRLLGERLLGERLIGERLAGPVLVVNDLTAAVWRYVGPVPDPFCLITVSSGVGNKIFHAGRVMIDPDGFGGELGHWTCDPSPDAPVCQCGGRGHLGGIASGRGAVAVARRLRERDPASFADSPDTERDLARAVAAGDPFATTVLRVGLGHLAAGITALATAAGLRRFVIIGGFALGVGPRYVELLTGELLRRGCFGLSTDEIRRMVTLGEPDDDHSLIGVGRLLLAHRTTR